MRAAEITVSGDCTLVDAVTAANTDTATGGCQAGHGADSLVLEPEHTYSLFVVDNSYPTHGIYGSNGLPPITSTVAISGNGATIARDLTFSCPGDGDPEFRIFYVDAAGDLTLQDVTVTNACTYSDGGGGVANFGGKVSLLNSRIVSNSTRFGDGGGLHNDAGSMTILNTQILSNTGGGIYNVGASAMLTISEQSTVAANEGGTNHSGGINNYLGTVTVKHSQVVSNSAHYGGGIHNAKGTVTVQSSQILTNSAQEGGGIYNSGGTVAVYGSQIRSNTAGWGGGVFSTVSYGGNAMVTILEQSTVSDNSAGSGAGLYNEGGDMAVQDSRLHSNRAGVKGGGAFILGPTGVLSVTRSSLLDNTAGETAGALYQEGGASALTQSCIVGNSDTAVFFDGGDSPIVATDNWWGVADGPSFAGPGRGDSVSSRVDFSRHKTAPVLECPTRHPATINVSGPCTLVDAINAANTDSAVGGCEAGSGADTLMLEPNVTYTLSDFDNWWGGNNGLPHITSTITISGSGSTIARDLSFGCPGGDDPEFRIFYVGETGRLNLHDLTVTNGCIGDGGGLVNHGIVTLEHSHFLRNTANFGGGLSSYGDRAVMTMRSSTIAGNVARFDGGALSGSGTVTIQNSLIFSNTAYGKGPYHDSGHGGGLYVGGKISITHSSLIGNLSVKDGGALIVLHGEGSIRQSCIVGNSDSAVAASETSSPVDATENWWGAADGPSGVGPGSGDSVGGRVDYYGFTTAPLQDCPGMQPLFLPAVRRE